MWSVGKFTLHNDATVTLWLQDDASQWWHRRVTVTRRIQPIGRHGIQLLAMRNSSWTWHHVAELRARIFLIFLSEECNPRCANGESLQHALRSFYFPSNRFLTVCGGRRFSVGWSQSMTVEVLCTRLHHYWLSSVPQPWRHCSVSWKFFFFLCRREFIGLLAISLWNQKKRVGAVTSWSLGNTARTQWRRC